eukprot:295030-Chlamydomonas_euryale.AAC.11
MKTWVKSVLYLDRLLQRDAYMRGTAGRPPEVAQRWRSCATGERLGATTAQIAATWKGGGRHVCGRRARSGGATWLEGRFGRQQRHSPHFTRRPCDGRPPSRIPCKVVAPPRGWHGIKWSRSTHRHVFSWGTLLKIRHAITTRELMLGCLASRQQCRS